MGCKLRCKVAAPKRMKASMGKLSKAPVFFTLAQMRFNPVLGMEPLLPALQDAFRKQGFPDYEISKMEGIEMSQGPDGFSINQKSVVRHVFRNKTKTAAILLDPSALTYELTDYPVFVEFSETFCAALEVVNEHRAIEYYDRLGMRMVDAIQPSAGEELDQYVTPQALGLKSVLDSDAEHVQSLTESVFRSGHQTLVVRTFRALNGIHVPPDLKPLKLNVNPRFSDYEGDALMLDSDSSLEIRRPDFSLDSVREELSSLKARLSSSFTSVVTPHALEAWK